MFLAQKKTPYLSRYSDVMGAVIGLVALDPVSVFIDVNAGDSPSKLI